MRIEQSHLALASTHAASLERETLSSTTFRAQLAAADSRLENAQAAPDPENSASLPALKRRLAELMQDLLTALLAAVSGNGCRDHDAASPPCATPFSALPAPQPEMTWQQETLTRVRETEETTVSGEGQVMTADGRCLAIDFSVNLCRSFEAERHTVQSGSVALRDPLVLSFSGTAAELSGQRLAFDLNADGALEDLAGLDAASGFLVFDRNSNGRADDGGELFGSLSGNGFADLARYDDDSNGWIDEGDAVFSRLSLWMGGATEESLVPLSEKGVGALYLGSVDSPFALKDSAGELLGALRTAGLYLKENGEAGLLQQLDLASSDPAIPPDEEPQERQRLAA